MTPSSVLGEELEVLADHIVKTRIKSTMLRDADLINFFNFNLLVYKSCLTDEMKQRLTGKPGKEWTFSVFRPRDKSFDLMRIKRGLQKNMQLYRPPKHVRWQGLHPIEEDEVRYAQRRMLKDAPKGVELTKESEEQEAPPKKQQAFSRQNSVKKKKS